jgi:hypothetical protein
MPFFFFMAGSQVLVIDYYVYLVAQPRSFTTGDRNFPVGLEFFDGFCVNTQGYCYCSVGITKTHRESIVPTGKYQLPCRFEKSTQENGSTDREFM